MVISHYGSFFVFLCMFFDSIFPDSNIVRFLDFLIRNFPDFMAKDCSCKDGQGLNRYSETRLKLFVNIMQHIEKEICMFSNVVPHIWLSEIV